MKEKNKKIEKKFYLKFKYTDINFSFFPFFFSFFFIGRFSVVKSHRTDIFRKKKMSK